MTSRLIGPELDGDVLRIGLLGQVDRLSMQLLVAHAAARLPPRGHDYGAMLLDLTQAGPMLLTPRALAQLWLERLPRRPCAVLRSGSAVIFCRELALLLASSQDQPTPMDAFDREEIGAALQWCRERALTYRAETQAAHRSR